MKVILATVVTLTLASSAVLTQTAAPTPGAEQKRMAYFVGSDHPGRNQAVAARPAGKTTSTETCEWFAGGFHLVCRTKGTGPKGPATGQSVMAYDQMPKASIPGTQSRASATTSSRAGRSPEKSGPGPMN